MSEINWALTGFSSPSHQNKQPILPPGPLCYGDTRQTPASSITALALYTHFPSQLFEAHTPTDQVSLLVQDRPLSVSRCGVTLTVVIVVDDVFVCVFGVCESVCERVCVCVHACVCVSV